MQNGAFSTCYLAHFQPAIWRIFNLLFGVVLTCCLAHFQPAIWRVQDMKSVSAQLPSRLPYPFPHAAFL